MQMRMTWTLVSLFYDSPKHYQQFTAEQGESLQSHVDHMNLATKESEEENLVQVKTPKQTDQPEVLNDKPEVRKWNRKSKRHTQ